MKRLNNRNTDDNKNSINNINNSKELEYKDGIYVENVIMDPMGIRSRPKQIQRIGISKQERASKERYRPLKVSLKGVEAKSQFLRNLTRLEGFKITKDLTKQAKILVREWQDKASTKNEIEQNKTYKFTSIVIQTTQGGVVL